MAMLPERFFERLHALYDEPTKTTVLEALALPKRHAVLRINTLKASEELTLRSLEEKGFGVESLGIPLAYRLVKGTQKGLEQTEEYKNGTLYLQQLSSQIPPLALELQEGERVLDVTAAPGSKTTQMAALMNNKGTIIANELDPIRVKRLRHNLGHLGCKNVTVRQGNALDLATAFKTESFDKILCDLPCSAEGRISLTNEKSFGFWNEAMFSKHYKHQRNILRRVIPLLKPGGILVYSTCTLAPEENEAIAHYVISNHPELTLEPTGITLPSTMPGLVRFEQTVFNKNVTLTLRGNPCETTEGFFVAKFRKNVLL